jgi:hypothetical protein
MKILEIIRDVKSLPIPNTFRVGYPVVEGGHIISEILYCRDGYSSGSKGRRASYAIKFVDSTEVRVIPETEIIDMAILPDDPSKDKKASVNPEATIPLPD